MVAVYGLISIFIAKIFFPFPQLFFLLLAHGQSKLSKCKKRLELYTVYIYNRIMKTVAMIHTVRNVVDIFDGQVKAAFGSSVRTHNILDDYLADDFAEKGVFTEVNEKRFLNDLENMALIEPDIIVVTCSSLSEYVPMYRGRFNVPVLGIGEALSRKVAAEYSDILIFATASTAVGPMRRGLVAEAEKLHKGIRLGEMSNPGAIAQLKAGNKAEHDRQVLDMARQIKGYGCVVMAQLSMSYLRDDIQDICGIPVFSAGESCIAEIRKIIGV